jgi:hypothetical protein
LFVNPDRPGQSVYALEDELYALLHRSKRSERQIDVDALLVVITALGAAPSVVLLFDANDVDGAARDIASIGALLWWFAWVFVWFLVTRVVLGRRIGR